MTRRANVVLTVSLMALGLVFPRLYAATVAVDGDLRIEVVTAYNLVVDSNIESPSTYGPSAATLGAVFHNDGANALTNVYAYIGNYNGGVNPTPGVYPSRAHLSLVGTFSLTHEGGALGTTDASRFLGTIAPGASVAVYWLVSYPRLDGAGKAVWGPDVKPTDDLYVHFDIWAQAMDDSVTLKADLRRKLTMRNEISAAANKILPNTANKVPESYQDLLQKYAPEWTSTNQDGTPGTRVYAEGVWYDLGNVGAGFDNNGDGIPDKNAWMQPIGDPALFDPALFRLVETYTLLVVKLKTGGERVYNVRNQLYFENIPENNGAFGFVRYEFIPLRGPGSSGLSPYQEVASGYDNEKFNGDFGLALGFLESKESNMTFDKYGDVVSVSAGGQIRYSMEYDNTGSISVGDPAVAMPLVISDSVPDGSSYVEGSAAISNTALNGLTYSILYSTNSGATWQNVEPVPASSVTDIQWWFSDALAASATGLVSFAVTVDDPYTNDAPWVCNTAGIGIANGQPFETDTFCTLVLGSNTVGDTVFADNGDGLAYGNGTQDTGENGIGNITVSLYYDADANGVLSAGDTLISTQVTDSAGSYLFTALPDGNYVVVLDTTDEDIPAGYTITTTGTIAVDLDTAHTNVTGVSYLDADFGLAPVLDVTKTLLDTSPVREGQQITYRIDVVNRFPGDGSGTPLPAIYDLWASATNSLLDNGTDAWSADYANTFGAPDGVFSVNALGNNQEELTLIGYEPSAPMGTITLLTVRARMSLPSISSEYKGAEIRLDLHDLRVGGAGEFFRYPDASKGADIEALSVTHGTNAFWYTVDVPTTSAPGGSWSWDDLGTNIALQVLVKKGGGSTAQYVRLDALGLRVITDAVYGTATTNNTLQPVPLVDTYDTNKLEFVSATPIETTVSASGAVGSITWNDIGPIYPGGTSSVTLVFNVLEPEDNASDTVITNTAYTLDAKYQNGWDANDDQDEALADVEPTGSIGDFVWRDINGDGVQDGPGNGEYGIANVTVTLTPPPGVDAGAGAGVTRTTVTDSNGYYVFANIPQSGIFTVTVETGTLPGSTFQNTYDEDDGTATDAIGGDPDNQTEVTLDHDAPSDGDNHLTADFGYQVDAVIDGLIWHDLNRSADATRDAGEPWLTSVSVQLYDSSGTLVGETSSDANGYFAFVGSFSGNYTVVVDRATGDMSGKTWTQSFDTDGLTSLDESGLSVTAGSSAHVDFSYYLTGEFDIGDTVFYDWDGQGDQDPAVDEGIPGITVWLYYDANGNGDVDSGTDIIIATDVTDVNGQYLFENYASGNYIVVLDASDPQFPAGYVQTQDPDGVKNNRGTVEVTNADRDDIDFAYMPAGSGAIGDTVWRDLNGNGVQAGPGETGIPDVTVSLLVDFNNDGTYLELTTTVTDADGKYLLQDLPDGKYRVDVSTTDSDLPQDAFGNLWRETTPTNVTTTLAGGNTYLDADFGFAPKGAIGDTIFWDSNANGTQDWNENGISNITVYLYYDANTNGFYDSGTDIPAGSTTTDTNGYYLFELLSPANYIVLVDTNDADLNGAILMADPDADGVPCTDVPPSYPAGCDGETDVELTVGQSFMGADFGFLPPGVIGDTVWFDVNTNGVKDSGEFGIPYVTVELYTNGILIATNVTDPDGYYVFDNLPDGTYKVAVATGDADFPSGVSQVFDPDSVLDHEATLIISNRHVVSIGGVSTNNADMNIDFGYRYAGTNVLSGTVGMDGPEYDGVLGNTGSGVNTNESAFSGETVYVYLWKDNGNDIAEANEVSLIATTTTATNGNYSFTGLPDGETGDRFLVILAAPIEHLFLTTTLASATPAVVLGQTTNSLGEVLTAFQGIDIPVDGVTTNVDFAFRLSEDYDFGDLPTSYGTRLDDVPVGPSHGIPSATSLYLGSTIDSEPNGQPSANATGDGADEDGVVVNKVWTNGVDGGEVVVTVGSGSGWLVAWVDFDNSGKFDQANEMIISRVVSAGVYTNTFDVPASTMNLTADTLLYARFRLFETEPAFPELAFSGQTGNGEVEDYLFTFPNPTLVNLVSFGAYAVDEGAMVEWRTSFELDTLGFYLERLTANGYERINARPIPADFLNPGGSTYAQLDPGAVGGGRYTYRLIELELSGTQRYLGPYTITVGSVPLTMDEWSRLMFSPAQLADNSVSGEDADPDGDGHSNREEYLTGTLPLDPKSVLRISSLNSSAEGTVVRWSSEGGRVYDVEVSTDGMRTYLPLAIGIDATPPENVYTGSLLRAGGPRFYRVRAVRP